MPSAAAPSIVRRFAKEMTEQLGVRGNGAVAIGQEAVRDAAISS